MSGVRLCGVSPLALLALLLFGAPTDASGQNWAGWSFYWENDTWVPSVLGSDDGFTNGLRLVLGRDARANLPLAKHWEALFPRSKDYDVTSALVLGQNFFTPRSITEFTPDPADRPYAGFTYLGARYDATSRLQIAAGLPVDAQHQVQHSIEVDLGIIGPAAGSRVVQAGVHSVITTHRVPKGWSEQVNGWPELLGNGPGASVFYMVRSRWSDRLIRSVMGDVTFHGGGMVGTTQIYPMGGLTARLGRGISGFPGVLGRNTVKAAQTRHPLEFGLSGGVEGRYVLHNAFVQGAWGRKGSPGVTHEPWIGEYSVGLFMRVLDVRVDYQFVRRSPEVTQAGPSEGAIDRYGSVSVTFEPGPEKFSCACVEDFFAVTLPSWFSGFYLEAGFGSELRGKDAGVERTNAMHGALGRRLWKDLDIGFERSGVGREFGEPATPGEDHRDRMLYFSALTLRYRLLSGRLGPFGVHVRTGLTSGTDEVELTPASTGPRVPPCTAGFTLDPPDNALDKAHCTRTVAGTGWLAGAGVSWRPTGEELGLNLDLLRSRAGNGAGASFFTWSLGLIWTPS